MNAKSKYQTVGLFISHSLYLTREQRYQLAERQAVEIVGVSIPVWFGQKSSEPATEVFCEYLIENKAGKAYVRAKGNRYHVNLPQLPSDYVPPDPIDFELIAGMPREQREAYFEYRDRMLAAADKMLSGENLKDRQDGGSEYLRFDVVTKGNLIQDPSVIVTVQHILEVKPIEILEATMVM